MRDRGTPKSMTKHLLEPEEENNVVALKLITSDGGSGGNSWLALYPIGASFLACAKDSKTFDLMEFHVQNIVGRAYMLRAVMADNSELYRWVKPQEFSSQFELYQVIRDQPLEETEE